MLLAAADPGADGIEFQLQCAGNLLVFQFFNHVFDHHFFIEGRQFLDEGEQAAVVFILDDLFFRVDVGDGIGRVLSAVPFFHAFFLLVFPPDGVQMVQGGTGGDGIQPGTKRARGIKTAQGDKRLLETLADHVVHIRLPFEIAAHPAPDGFFMEFIDGPVGHFVAFYRTGDQLRFIQGKIIHLNVLPTSFFRRCIPPSAVRTV